ncbi:CPBP family intramembrane glutamic endopeptidase [Thermospira aquatica]|uniref:CPBP family intramembrane metalloprotease n=1 Tax=Thermospira aquatica TaxID=2828656 RepID=A0AAX3BCM2_9SPIR|nr:type II CAAX endopeptidase family protein [Thermospira aquatica]URA09766.1 CPBP family intramembrane metalloprotease [Thermospira aquatica]
MLTGKRKVFILLSILDKQIVKKVLVFLGKNERRIVASLLKNNIKFSETEKIKVLKEFLATMEFYRKLRKLNINLYFRIGLLFLTTASFVFLYNFDGISHIISEFIKFLAIGGEYIFVFPILMVYIRNKTGKSFFSYGYTTKKPLYDIFIGIVASVCVFLLLSLLNLSLTEETALSGFYKATYILILSLLAPLCEETIFRGIIYDLIEKKFNHNLALLGSSFLFTFAHLPKDLNEIFLYFLISFILGILRFSSRNLIPSTIAHAFSNILVYLVY